jgi:RNA polymerase primary sigma factor
MKEILLMRSEPTGKLKQNAIQSASSHGAEPRKRGRRADRAGQREIRPYLSSIKYGKLLSASEETGLAKAIARGDKDALDRLIQSNLRLVVKIAQAYAGQGVMIDDLIGEGNLSLIRAAEQYQPSHGVRFSTYASVWIKKAMRQAILTSSGMIRLPSHILSTLCKWRKAERALARESGRKPTFDEVAMVLGLSELQKSRLARALVVRRVQQESTVVREKGGWSSAEALDPYEPPELTDDFPDEKLVLEPRLECLNEREKLVLAMRHGLGKKAPMKLSEIAECLGVTKECVRLIELRAGQKLRGEAALVTSELPQGPGRRKRRRRGGKIVRRKGKSSKHRARVTPAPQSPGRESGGAELSAAPVAEPDRIPPPYLNGASPRP